MTSSTFESIPKEIVDIMSCRLKEFSDIDAAHKVGFNIKGLNSTGNESTEVRKLPRPPYQSLSIEVLTN